MPPNLKKLEERIAGIAKDQVNRMDDRGSQCDFVKEVALWYPLCVMMMIMAVLPEDEAFMLRMTQEIFGPGDPTSPRPPRRIRAPSAWKVNPST